MSGALDQLENFNTELLRNNRFCMGRKRGKRYVCGGNVDDPEKVNNAVDLLDEAVRRLLH